MITGATGFLGSTFLIDILRSGYTAHIVVRSEAKAQSLRQAPDLAALNKSTACHYFVVPDLTLPGALDAATAGTDYIIHCATPLPFGAAVHEYTTPTVACTLNALESARASGTVKRVVLIASLGVFASPELLGGAYEPADGEALVLGETPNEVFDPPYANPLVAYCAAKTAGFRKARGWIAEKAAAGGVGFDLVSIAPAYTFGYHPLAASVADLMGCSNSVLLKVVAGGANAMPPPDPQAPKFLFAGITLTDVAKAVRLSLDLERVKTPASGTEQGFSSYVMANVYALNDAYPIVARQWPEEVKLGLLRDQGDWPSKKNVSVAMGGFHETFGFEAAGLEDMLDAIVPQYLELAEKDKSAAV